MKSEKAMRETFGDALVHLGQLHDELVVLDADVSNSTRTVVFRQQFPERFFNMGVAEAGMVSVAGGLATSGLRPVVSAFAVFLSLKATEQIRNIICYNNMPVILAGGYAGLSDSYDGASHQAIEDIAIMRALPNMRVVVPPSASTVEILLKSAFESKQPVYLRLCRNPLPALNLNIDRPFDENSWLFAEGNDITIVVCGVPSFMAIEAAELLIEKDISAEVIIVSTLKPFDPSTVNSSIAKTGRILTVEEHSVIGGLRSVVLENCNNNISFEIESIAINDVFGETGSYEELLEKHGLTIDNIMNRCEKLVERCKK